MRLIYSTRSPDTLLYAAELERIAAAGTGLSIDLVYTRAAPPGSRGPTGRLDARTSRSPGRTARRRPAVLHLRADGIRGKHRPPARRAGHGGGRSKPSGSGPAEAPHDRHVDRRQQHRRPAARRVLRRHHAATGRCAGCGRTGPLAEGRVFSHSPGLVLRCPACGQRSCAWPAPPAAPGSTCAAWNTSNWRHPSRRWLGLFPPWTGAATIAGTWRGLVRCPVRRRGIGVPPMPGAAVSAGWCGGPRPVRPSGRLPRGCPAAGCRTGRGR